MAGVSIRDVRKGFGLVELPRGLAWKSRMALR
jgi:hypothetical protein